MTQEGQEENPFHVYDADGNELESVENQALAEEQAEPIGGYVIWGGTQIPDQETGRLRRVNGKVMADFRGQAATATDVTEGLPEEEREKLIEQVKAQNIAAAAGMPVSAGGDILAAAGAVLGGLVARPDFDPGDANIVAAAVNMSAALAAQLAEHPTIKAAAPRMAVQAMGQPNIFAGAQVHATKGPDGKQLFVPPKKVRMTKNGRTFYVDPDSPEGKEAARQEAEREARGRPATDF